MTNPSNGFAARRGGEDAEAETFVRRTRRIFDRIPRISIGIGLAGLLVIAVGVANCQPSSNLLDPPVIIGVSTDQPGMGYQDPGTNRRSGFDVSFYRWLAISADEPFTPTEADVTVDGRELALQTAQVDLVFASYSITTDREMKVDFAGPYLITQQGLMVRSDNQAAISRVQDLAGKRVCAPSGSTSVRELRQIPGVIIIEPIGLIECVQRLLEREVETVSTDQILLYGYADRDPTLRVLPNVTFGALQKYGIGLPPHPSTENCELMTTKLKIFIDTGAWDTAFRNNFGSDLDPARYRPESKSLRPCIEDPE